MLSVTNSLPPDVARAILPLTEAVGGLLVNYIENTIMYSKGDTKKNGESILRILNAADKNARN